MAYFAVVVNRGPHWDWNRSMRRQNGWDEHAAFMDMLGSERFIVSGGPLGGEDDARRILHIVNAPDISTVKNRLSEDPWHQTGLLQIESIEPWTVLVGSQP